MAQTPAAPADAFLSALGAVLASPQFRPVWLVIALYLVWRALIVRQKRAKRKRR